MSVARQQLPFDGCIECSHCPAISVAEVARGLGAPDRLWAGSAGAAEELGTLLTNSRGWTGRPGVLEVCICREEMLPFTPFLSADALTYHAAPLGSAEPGRRTTGGKSDDRDGQVPRPRRPA